METGYRGELLERERELAAIEAHLDAARSGRGRVVLVEGPQGIGKTTLLTAAREQHAARVRWLAARGAEQERDHAFGVVRQLLEPVPAEDESLLQGAAALARTVLAPGEPSSWSAPDSGFAGLHGLFWLVHNLAEREPLVLAVDDLHWADAPSLRFLDYLAVRLEGLPLLVLLTTRAGDATLTLGPIARLAAHADVHTVALPPLGSAAVARWLQAEGVSEVSDDLVTACCQATGGNPFLLSAVIAELRRDPAAADPEAVRQLAPATIVRSVGVRLSALDEAAIGLARAAAVLGDPAELAEAATLAQMGHAEAASAADALAAAGILRPGRPLQFVHPIVLAAVRESLRPAARDLLHRRAARLAVQNGDRVAAAAGHLLATDPAGDAWAAEVLLRAANDAARRGAADVAVTFLRRAAAEPPGERLRARVDLDLARIAGLSGEPDSLALAERAAETIDEPGMRLAAARELALQHALDGRHEEAAAVLGRVLGETDGAAPEQRLLAEGMLLLSAGQSAPSRQAHRDRLERAASAARAADAPGPLLVIGGFELVAVHGDVDEGCALVERGLDSGGLLRKLTGDSPFPFMAAIALLVGGRYAAADQLTTEVIGDASRRGSMRGFLVGNALRAMVRLRRGDLRGAEADARAVLEADEEPMLLADVYSRAALCGVLVERGELDEADHVLAGVPAGVESAAGHLGHHVADMRARLRLAQGRPVEALAELERCRIYEQQMEICRGCWSAWRAKAAEAHLALGARARAVAVADDALALARELGTPRALGLALRARGIVADREQRLDLLAQAAGVFERGGAVVERARALAELGSTLHAVGREQEARATLERALELADGVGATVVAAAAWDGLVALGARPRRREVTGAAALTPAERRVAELAARGASNREIAEGLFLTLKTVENHLTSAYRKLGISSRTQLADRLR